MIVLRALFAILAFIGALCLLVGAATWLDARWTRREMRQKVEAWRRARKRAKIVRCGDGIGLVTQGGEIAHDVDPLTREPIILGWSATELREVESRRSEFITE